VTDVLTPEQRRRNMQAVRSSGTRPEMAVRSLAHRLGYRFRLHRRDLPGKPDLVFSSRRKVIFVHGCFWHQHPGCRFAARPSTRAEFWEAKLDGNVRRDARVQTQLTERGWSVLVVWECETRSEEAMATRIKRFLGPIES